MDEDELKRRREEHARIIANYLEVVEPAEHGAVLDAALKLHAERAAGIPPERQADEAIADTRAIISQWLVDLVRRLSPEALADLAEDFKEVEAADRWERLVADAIIDDDPAGGD